MNVDTGDIKKLLDDPDTFIGLDLFFDFYIIALCSRYPSEIKGTRKSLKPRHQCRSH